MIYTASGEILPALRSTAVSDAFLGINAPPANRAAFIIEGNNAKKGRSGYFPNWGPLNGKVISPNLSRIWSGSEPVRSVLQQTCKDVNTFLQSISYQGQQIFATMQLRIMWLFRHNEIKGPIDRKCQGKILRPDTNPPALYKRTQMFAFKTKTPHRVRFGRRDAYNILILIFSE